MENLSLLDVNKPEKVKQALNELINHNNISTNLGSAAYKNVSEIEDMINNAIYDSITSVLDSEV